MGVLLLTGKKLNEVLTSAKCADRYRLMYNAATQAASP